MSQLQRRCGTMDLHEKLLRESAEYAKNRAEIEKFTADFKKSKLLLAADRGIIRIPVVVHVVYNTPVQNVPDEQINSQMVVLNQDFRSLNADIVNVPGVFQDRIADARVEFTLATVDPQGNPTNGIVRVPTNVTEFTIEADNVKFTVAGGSDAWPSDKYLNMWVCNLEGGLLGYAQFPGGPANTDGVVIDFQAFGTTGTAAPPFHLGRTATHEVGHWLNLFHIWGDDGEACTGSDLVDDTPNQAGPNFGCPTFPHITCSNGPNGDMFMNYMDYGDDHCIIMFSKGQADRMDACLQGPRSSFLIYEVRNADLSIEFTGTPAFIEAGKNFTVVQRVRNLGPDKAREVTLSFVLPENTQYVSSTPEGTMNGNLVTWTLGDLANGAMLDVSITLLPTNNQLTCLQASVSSIEADPDTGNNSIEQCLMAFQTERIRAARVIDSTTYSKQLRGIIKTDKTITSCQILEIKSETDHVSLPDAAGNVRAKVETEIVVGLPLSNGQRIKCKMESTHHVQLMAPPGTRISSDILSYSCSFEQLEEDKYKITVIFQQSVQSTQNTILDIPVIG
ncbi:M43 family zinc metalloprotease [Niallia endozanthoxylica]|uniref:DUF11 domain-containing protein n=1 Tax=Niallia endozanthoxylica TaxID=2036016 RepID=A0A5J5I501_9BACI|nr:M43 family zinc metalloprotease [Niallia endozanthoxylica]KAA9030683.1 DUF11 domain-containing protein [Niallia endozanthoxylica]